MALLSELFVYLSGVHSGPNPSPGVGVARSLRQGFPTSTLIAVDYSNRSTGLYWPGFNSRWVPPSWDELDLQSYSLQIVNRLESHAGIWISGLDLETMWLAKVLPDHPRILIPSCAALDTLRKPAQCVASALGIRTPSWISLKASPQDLHTFGRRCGWQMWLKGPWYEATWITCWPDILPALDRMDTTWGCGRTAFLQRHIVGKEESIAFASYRGRLLSCIKMVKSEVTAEGKTWAGTITEVPSDLAVRLAAFLEHLGYTGGGEVEMVRDAADELWLIEVNPRFPAWIYGATLAGYNLPAVLVADATGVAAQDTFRISTRFARIVLEFPVTEGVTDIAEAEMVVMRTAGAPQAGKFIPDIASSFFKKPPSTFSKPPSVFSKPPSMHPSGDSQTGESPWTESI